MESFELSLLDPIHVGTEPNEADEIIQLIQTCQFEDVLTNVKMLKYLNNISTKGEENISFDIVDIQGKMELFCFGVACLQLFVQDNFVGPPTQKSLHDILPDIFSSNFSKISEKQLTPRGTEINAATLHAEFCYFAKLIFDYLSDFSNLFKTLELWKLRCNWVHEQILSDPSSELYDETKKLIMSLDESSFLEENSDIQLEFYLQSAYMLKKYHDHATYDIFVTKALELSSLDVNLTGVLGKRTKFQEVPIAQLILNVNKGGGDFDKDLNRPKPTGKLPKNLELDDDTVLDKIQLSDDDYQNNKLTILQQAVLLCLSLKRTVTHVSNASIIREENLAYLNVVLEDPQCWSVQTLALLNRTRWECDSPRRMERGLRQLEQLVGQFRSSDQGQVVDRLRNRFAVGLPPIWQIELDEAYFFLTIGAVQSALDVFTRLQNWDEVIKCYASLGKIDKAERLIRIELNKQETPTMYCYLGDVLTDSSYYEKAWQLSQHRCSRAQRSLAYYHLRRQEYAESLPHFELCLNINSLQVKVWFSYGCAALSCENYEKASIAFRRCVNIDSDNFEAWSNLATAYIKLKQKPRAFIALQESLKWEYENPKLWYNYMSVATDCGEFNEAIRAYGRLLDLEDKFSDAPVIKVLVRAVTENITDAKGINSITYLSSLRKLLGRITSMVLSNGDIWRSYAELLLFNSNFHADKEMVLQYLNKAHKSYTLNTNWFKDLDQCKLVSENITYLANVCIDMHKINNNVSSKRNLVTVKFSMRSTILSIKKNEHDSVLEAAWFKELNEAFKTIEELLNEK